VSDKLKADGDTEMTCRKGDITYGGLKRKWPHHMALPVVLSATSLTYSLRRDDSDFVT
jgi:hypothetical protein